MGMRIRLARFLLQLADFIQSLPVVVMKPDDLVEFSRQSYDRPHNVEAWAEDGLVDSGLSREEAELIAEVPAATGNLLLLGLGGGREAIPLARMGFRVTGVDYVAAMVDRAKDNAARRGVQIEGLVQEISQLDVPAGTYDVVWLSRHMYSCVPTRARRVAMVRRIARALKPGGLFLCQFQWNPGARLMTRAGRLLRRLVAAGTLGNLAYEEGDILWLRVEFVHQFSSEDALRSELEEGGLAVLHIKTSGASIKGSAVCQKNLPAEPKAVL
jgi:2-polyprenyl-3-methyl-5-hydroxy-6-metoxy-1,4-benzoquinol methylase